LRPADGQNFTPPPVRAGGRRLGEGREWAVPPPVVSVALLRGQRAVGQSVFADLAECIGQGQDLQPLAGIQRGGVTAKAIDSDVAFEGFTLGVDASQGASLDDDVAIASDSLDLEGIVLGMELGKLEAEGCVLVLEDCHGVCPVCKTVGFPAASGPSHIPRAVSNHVFVIERIENTLEAKAETLSRVWRRFGVLSRPGPSD